MLQHEKLVEEVRDLEIHFIERLDDGADGKELASIFNQIKSLKKKLNTKGYNQTTASPEQKCLAAVHV